MHSVTFVLLRPPTGDLHGAIDALLAPYRLDEEHYDHPWRFDYWTIGEGTLDDAATAAALGVTEDEDFKSNVCFVSRVGDRCIPANIVTPDGVWHSLSDFGWKFRERDLAAGQEAYARWCAHAATVLGAHEDCVAVEIDTHS